MPSGDRSDLARRELLKLALGSAAAAALPLRLVRAAAAAPTRQDAASAVAPPSAPLDLPFTPIPASSLDELVLAPEFANQWEIVAAAGEPLGESIGAFGDGCDFTAFLPIDRLKFAPDLAAPHRGFASASMSSREGLLVVNHEGLSLKIFHADWKPGEAKSSAQLLPEMRALGISVIHVVRGVDGRWHLRKASPYPRRVDATTWCTLTGPAAAIDGGPAARGTFANCSGAITPWASVLSCEENFHEMTHPLLQFRWPDEPYKNRRHYGWVVEIDPFDARSPIRKHTALGRMRHENVALRVVNDGTLVAYLGDDRVGGCLYKFVAEGRVSGDRAADSKLLESGQLFVAQLGEPIDAAAAPDAEPGASCARRGRWLAMPMEPEALADAHETAMKLGATPLDRPEDAEIHPLDGSLYAALTNNKLRQPQDWHGRIVRLAERDGDPRASEFEWRDFAIGGPTEDGGGFSCPDNLLFDRHGDLWVTCDVSAEELGKPPYAERKNNGLFFFRTSGPLAGRAFQAASGPVQAELTGPCVTPDGSTLFVSVQHPGEGSRSRASLTSHWPGGGDSLPRSAVVAIRGFAA